MRTIVINSSNHVQGTRNKFVYTFPSQLKLTENHRIGVSGISMYNSTFNIEAKRGNNTITLIWNADSQTSHAFTFPDGYYSVAQMNEFLQENKARILRHDVCNSFSGYVVTINLPFFFYSLISMIAISYRCCSMYVLFYGRILSNFNHLY